MKTSKRGKGWQRTKEHPLAYMPSSQPMVISASIFAALLLTAAQLTVHVHVSLATFIGTATLNHILRITS